MQLSNLVVDGTAQDVLPGLPVMGRIPQAGEVEKGSDAAHAVPPLVYVPVPWQLPSSMQT
jgi:hypothetical protein